MSRDSMYSDVSTRIIRDIDISLPFFHFDGVVDWDEVYRFWVMYARFCRRHHLERKDSPLEES